MKFALLASGSKGNACIVKSKDTHILIDCGTTQKYLKNSFASLQLDVEKIDALLLTHSHSDHISAVKLFEPYPKYGHAALRVHGHTPVEPLAQWTIKDVVITAIPLSHDSEGTMGYVLRSESHSLVYITDTGYVKEELLPLIRNADYYIFESNHDVELLMATNRPMSIKQRILSDSGHLCNEDAAGLLAKLVGPQTKEIVLAHLSEEGNHPQLALKVLHETFALHGVDATHLKVRAASQFQILIGGTIS
ncbi:MAG: MBL fold metallo-hydrolase [Erysipelotrichaceae bacterium]